MWDTIHHCYDRYTRWYTLSALLGEPIVDAASTSVHRIDAVRRSTKRALPADTNAGFKRVTEEEMMLDRYV
ncbi:hypothetical protein Harman_29950 [Haloarcula mannanilytica]|uniref:Uncharacterized protein n=1 Tax=Haloarcula mannanilytica TaxID=2509225 RepID=A0A4C2ENS8_9EURY|nr:hypothetical protein Harman_29950 [Haloarcula mannanilytica]